VLAVASANILTPAIAAARAPHTATCQPPESPDGGERQRTRPLPVPPMLRTLIASGVYHYAISTLGGGTVCVDTSWMETAEDLVLSPDARFVSFRWLGYESYGFKLVDRAGRGQVIEVGAAPVFAPSRRLIAAVDQTESEFGSLSGLALWRVGLAGVSELVRTPDIPRMYDWRIDRWVGEDCIDLSAIPLDKVPDDPADLTKVVRTRYSARAASRWAVVPAPRGGCAAH
jgi:hypothetical protein